MPLTFNISAYSRILSITLIAAALTASAQRVPQDNLGKGPLTDVDEHRGDTLPLDLEFISSSGMKTRLGDVFEDGKPVVLVLAYYECPMLCSKVLQGVSDSIKLMDWKPGEEFNMVTISINPRETPELARAKQNIHLKRIGLEEGTNAGWQFWVGDQEPIHELADAVGFRYFYDKDLKQYSHPAVVFIITPKGVISRYLYGFSFSNSMENAVFEAADGKVGTFVERLILSCYTYDPDLHKYTPVAWRFMRLAAIVTLIGLGTLLGSMWAWELRGRKRKGSAA